MCKPGDDAGEGKSRDFPQEEEVEEEVEKEERGRTSRISCTGRELSSTNLDPSPFAYFAQIRKRDNRRNKV